MPKYALINEIVKKQPLVMGILNVTPDSFSDGGQLYKNGQSDSQKIKAKALRMANNGADIIDIGGESTGPQSKNIPLQEELKRIIPAVKVLHELKKNRQEKFIISVDTYKAEVARQALEMGADMINDVTAFRGDLKMAQIIARYNVPIVIMYAKDATARTTSKKVHYTDVIKTIKKFLEERMHYGITQGIKKNQFILDPGMGAFISDNPAYSLQILGRLEAFTTYELPILIGASRKGFIGQILGKGKTILPIRQRLEGGLACAAVAVMNNAGIIRTHDVKETRRVVDMVAQIKKFTYNS